MNQFIAEHTIELLDRKYNFVMNSSIESSMLDLEGFIKFLTEEDKVKDFTGKQRSSFFSPQPTVTMYSVNTERLVRTRFADSMSSRTVVINSSTVSGVNDASPVSVQTHA